MKVHTPTMHWNINNSLMLNSRNIPPKWPLIWFLPLPSRQDLKQVVSFYNKTIIRLFKEIPRPQWLFNSPIKFQLKREAIYLTFGCGSSDVLWLEESWYCTYLWQYYYIRFLLKYDPISLPMCGILVRSKFTQGERGVWELYMQGGNPPLPSIEIIKEK